MRITDLYKEWYNGTDGIFKDLNSYDVPWKTDIPYTSLDVHYIGHSGNKYCSPLVIRLEELEVVPGETREKLALTVYNVYKQRWAKLWETLQFEYNPIENYNMVENGTETGETEHGHTVTNTDRRTLTKSGSEQFAKTNDILTYGDQETSYAGTETDTNTNLKDTETFSNYKETTEHEIAGFNSAEYHNGEKDTTTRTGSRENNRTGSTSHSYNNRKDTTTHGNDTIAHGTETTTYNNVTDTHGGTLTEAHSGSDTEERSHTLTRAGNIGVTTSQQMIQQERELWMWNFIDDVVIPDIDKILTIMVY